MIFQFPLKRSNFDLQTDHMRNLIAWQRVVATSIVIRHTALARTQWQGRSGELCEPSTAHQRFGLKYARGLSSNAPLHDFDISLARRLVLPTFYSHALHRIHQSSGTVLNDFALHDDFSLLGNRSILGWAGERNLARASLRNTGG